MIALPQTGTSALLEALSPFIDDAQLNELLPEPRGPGRPRLFSSAQLLRVLLLSLLTPAHSFNLLLRLLPEHRAWRKFAHLPNQRVIPDPKMLNEFRARLDLGALRRWNAQLLSPLLDQLDPARLPLAIIDATDLPAPVHAFKKRSTLYGPPCGGGRTHDQDRTLQMVYRLQEAQLAAVARTTSSIYFVGAINLLDRPCQPRGCTLFRTQPAVSAPAFGF